MSRTKTLKGSKTSRRTKKPSRSKATSGSKKRRTASGKATHILEVLFQDEVTPNRYDDSAAATPSKGARRGGMLTQQVRGWRVAESLQRLLAQVNQMAPSRNKASDGSIGDPRHQSHASDHNPWIVDGKMGVVTARDITHDPRNGCDAQKIADSIVASRDPRVKYLIWNRQICSSQVQPWTWRRYTGSNPHNKHIHISVLPQKAKYDDTSDWHLTQVELQRLALALGADSVDDVALAWGKKVTPAFKRKVIEISAEIGMDPNFLMAAMAFESARTFSANVQNPSSRAVGLIQFMPSTARALGTSTEALKRMTPLAQLDYVERYFLPNKGRLRDLNDVYMAILWPRAIGRPSSYILFAQGSNQYRQNRGLDADNDGVVTKAEAANRVQQHLVEGMREELRG
jgi:Transglycosylase SLT domain